MKRRTVLSGTVASFTVIAGAAAFADDRAGRRRRVFEDPEQEIGQLVREAQTGAPWYAPLTPRRAYIAELIAAGLTTAQIAARLGIAKRTTEVHVVYVFQQLDVGSRKAVTKWVAKHRPRTGVMPAV